MKSTLLSFALICIISVSLSGQIYVSTTAMNKVAVIEEFTGVRCSNCPDGHTTLASILTSNPGQAIGIGYHPSNSSYTSPYTGNPDFRRSYLDAFYTTPFCGSSRFMPSAFINRREWSTGEKISSRTIWSSSATSIMGESSPLNVGLYAEYDASTNTLDVTVEVYFTADVSDNVFLYVALAENNLVAEQSNGGSNYIHYHVFREALASEQWGESITGTTTTGSLFTQTYSFDNATAAYIMGNCEVSAFVRNATDEEIISGNQVPVTVINGVTEAEVNQPRLNIYPNPLSSNSVVSINWPVTENVQANIFDINGKLINSSTLHIQNGYNNIAMTSIYGSQLSAGNYYLLISGSTCSEKIPFFAP